MNEGLVHTTQPINELLEEIPVLEAFSNFSPKIQGYKKERNEHMKTRINITYPVLALACFALSPGTQALNNEGDIGNGNTVEARS